ncbi:hypothetical protein AB3M93_13910 [Novosphingobium panipatense]|jgi:hypothetical protein|uniref:hypothetical protein n=1 Tax=Novosphingobium TaxID=165696 RepID=UPI000CDA7E0B|nr:hypothetical protein [Novosphingobium sp. HII-3]
MHRNPAADWMKLAHDSYWLGVESLTVIGLRTFDIMTGQGSERENRLMVTEKVRAAATAGMMLAAGGGSATSTGKAVRHYRRKVAANRKRLTGKNR